MQRAHRPRDLAKTHILPLHVTNEVSLNRPREVNVSKRKFPWISGRKKTQPEVPYAPPVWLGNLSNGEFFLPQSDREKRTHDLILERCDEFARIKGMERREFIASTMGMATTLSVLNMAAGCGDEEGMMHRDTRERLMDGQNRASYEGSAGASRPRTSPSGRDAEGGYAIDRELCLNEEMADKLFKSDYFILDFQTHHTRDGMRGLCLTQQPVTPECTSPDTYIRQIFEESEQRWRCYRACPLRSTR